MVHLYFFLYLVWVFVYVWTSLWYWGIDLFVECHLIVEENGYWFTYKEVIYMKEWGFNILKMSCFVCISVEVQNIRKVEKILSFFFSRLLSSCILFYSNLSSLSFVPSLAFTISSFPWSVAFTVLSPPITHIYPSVDLYFLYPFSITISLSLLSPQDTSPTRHGSLWLMFPLLPSLSFPFPSLPFFFHSLSILLLLDPPSSLPSILIFFPLSWHALVFFLACTILSTLPLPSLLLPPSPLFPSLSSPHLVQPQTLLPSFPHQLLFLLHPSLPPLSPRVSSPLPSSPLLFPF